MQVQELGRRRKSLGSLFRWFGLKENFLSVLRWRREDRLFCFPAVMLACVTGLTNIARTQWHARLFMCGHACNFLFFHLFFITIIIDIIVIIMTQMWSRNSSLHVYVPYMHAFVHNTKKCVGVSQISLLC